MDYHCAAALLELPRAWAGQAQALEADSASREPPMSTLRDRCFEFLNGRGLLSATDWPSDVEHMEAFILAEMQRKAAPQFADAKPVVLMFATDADRDEFVELWKSLHPNAVTIKVEP